MKTIRKGFDLKNEIKKSVECGKFVSGSRGVGNCCNQAKVGHCCNS